MASTATLKISIDPIGETCSEHTIIERVLQLDHRQILELGCGRAELTRLLARGGPGRQIMALEVDEIQHARNLQIEDLPNVRFLLAGAQAIPAEAASIDVAFMFKSLHHVPVELMATSLRELARVLKPGGHAYLSEPIFAGEFNEILRLFHNEESVRTAAFRAIEDAVAAGLFESVEQIFFNAPMVFPDFNSFDRQVIGVTHTRHVLSPEVQAEVRRRFTALAGANGVRFEAPMRVDLLRKPGAPA